MYLGQNYHNLFNEVFLVRFFDKKYREELGVFHSCVCGEYNKYGI